MPVNYGKLSNFTQLTEGNSIVRISKGSPNYKILQLKGMTIGIYESEHFETVYPVLRVLDNGTNHITVYTNISVARQLKDQLGTDSQKFNWVIKEENQSIRSFIGVISEHVKQKSFDFFLLNTVSNNHLLFARMIKNNANTSFYLVVHDVNNLMLSKPGFGLRKLIRHLGKKMLVNNCKGFFAISSRTTNYLAGFIDDGRTVQWFPGAIYEDANSVSIKTEEISTLKVVVPGTLDSRRRNYQQVFKLAEQVFGKQMNIEICLLGGNSGKDSAALIEQCRQLSKKFNGFTYYDLPELSFEEFDKQMRSADFIWVPSTVNTIIADNIAETYGQSKSSGNMFDAIRYAKPLLVPASLTIDKEQEDAAIVYKDMEELIEILSNLQQSDKRAIWAGKALEVAKNYSVSKLQEKLVHYFTK